MLINDILFWLAAILVVCFGLIVFIGAPFVPSLNADVKKAFKDLYKLSSNDYLLDLGSGDGRILRLANQSGASSLGYELNPILYVYSKLRFLNSKNINIEYKSCWQKIPSEVTVAYAFVVNRDRAKLAKTIQKSMKGRKTTLYLITYGSELENNFAIPSNKLGAHFLYVFQPLHAPEHKYNKKYV